MTKRMIKYDPTLPQPNGKCRMCGRILSPRQDYCRKHKCNQTKKYGSVTLFCQNGLDHSGRCLFMYLGETIETGLR